VKNSQLIFYKQLNIGPVVKGRQSNHGAQNMVARECPRDRIFRSGQVPIERLQRTRNGQDGRKKAVARRPQSPLVLYVMRQWWWASAEMRLPSTKNGNMR